MDTIVGEVTKSVKLLRRIPDTCLYTSTQIGTVASAAGWEALDVILFTYGVRCRRHICLVERLITSYLCDQSACRALSSRRYTSSNSELTANSFLRCSEK